MSQMHEVVDFRTSADLSAAQGTVINSRAGTDFYVITDSNIADLRNASVLSVLGGKAETFTADDCMGPNNRIVTHNRVFHNHGTGINSRIGTDSHIIPDKHIGINNTACTDTYIFTDNRISHNGCIFADFCTLIDNSRRMNALLHTLPGMKEFQQFGKSQARIFHKNEGVISCRIFFLRNNRTGMNLRQVFRIRFDGKRNVVAPGFGQSFDIGNLPIFIAYNRAA